jgi:quercetin dioxygenase-like cupin family protein
MKRKVTLGVMSIAALAAVFASTSFGLTSTAVARGSIGAFTLQDKSQKLKLQSKDTLDIDIRRVTLDTNETINWHTHLGPSLVLVKAGSVTVSQPDGKACSVETYPTGSAFVHPEGVHKFVAGSDGAEIYIVYLLPESASPAATFVDGPGVCP